MATSTNEIRIVTTQAERALQNLQGNLGKLNNSFAGLKTAIAGLAIGNFITQAYAMADAIADMSQALGISIQSITSFQKAILGSVNGSDAATIGLGKFAQAIEAASDGSKEMQDRFLKLGIGLEELRTLSEEDLLGRVIQSLGAMSAGTERAGLGMALFGKSFRSADWTGISNKILDTTQAAGLSAASIQAAADASDNLDIALSQLKTAIIIALAPLSDMIITLSENKDALESLFETLIKVAGIFAGLFVVEKIIALFVGLKTAFAAVMAIGAATTATVASLGAAWVRLIPIVGQVAAVFMILNEVVNLITGNSIIDWAENVAKALGLISETSKETKAATDAEKERQAEIQRTQETAANANRQIVDAMAKQKEAIRGIVVAYQDATQAANEKYAADTSIIGASERQKLAVQELNAAYDQYRQQFTKLTNEYEKLRVGTESEKKAAQELYPEFAKLTEAYQNQKAKISELTSARATANEQFQLELFNTKSLIDSENKLMDIQDEIAKSTMSEIEKKYYDIDRAAQRSAKSAIEAEEARRGAPLNAQEVKAYYDAASQGTEQLKRATQGQYEQSRQFATGWKQAFQTYADEATNAAKIAQTIFNKTMTGLEDLIVNFAKTGKFEWKQFASSMLEELLRIQLRQTFSSILGGITDLFGGGDTGQGRGASANNPVYVADVTNGAGMGGGFAGGMGNYAGGGYGMGSLATGRGNPLSGLFDLGPNGNLPYQTEQAPTDWFSQTQAPNFYEPWKNAAGGGDPLGDFMGSLGLFTDSFDSAAESLSNWDPGISSIPTASYGSGEDLFSSIGGLFDGWFANGGTIGAGKFGVVGERGPELVSGPATVTPMSGGSNVTYNINAVDAASFKALVAQDPGFIHAIAMQGASSVPSRR